MIPAASTAPAAAPSGLTYRWVYAGLSGNLYTSESTTGATGTWTSRTSSFGTTDIRGVCADGTNYYVAVGLAGKLATSPDGITWTQRTSSFGTSDIQAIAWGKDGYWVAVGASGKVATATDPTGTWTQRTTGASGTTTVNTVAYGNGTWAIGCADGTLYTATNPTSTWTSRTSTITNVSNIYYAPNQAIWIAGSDSGTTGALASSTDAATWTARNSAFSLVLAGSSGSSASTSATIVQIGFDALLTTRANYGTNGTTWTAVTIQTSAVQAIAADASGTILAVGGTAGDNNYTTTNGSTWTNQGATPITVSGWLCHSSGMPATR